MKYYNQLKKLKSFRRKDIVELIGSRYRANLLINSYLEKGYIKRVRRNFYVVMDKEYGEPLLNRYQIATRLFDDAFLSHHAAFEFYSCVYMPYGVIEISTKHRFKEIKFDWYYFARVDYSVKRGICELDGIRVASLERTIVECIRKVNKLIDMYELIECIKLIDRPLNEVELLRILEDYGSGSLYQKCGYILEALNYDEKMEISYWFFTECRKHISKHKYYLDSKDICTTYNKTWRLYVPKSIHSYWCDYNGIPLELFLADECFKVDSI